eukprot:EC795448.1.p2 GENE.EC795448.1~~EC795448.1.p2  ORF type:complete len:167 (+),score=32.40 EC795448.1:129-629(+)
MRSSSSFSRDMSLSPTVPLTASSSSALSASATGTGNTRFHHHLGTGSNGSSPPASVGFSSSPTSPLIAGGVPGVGLSSSSAGPLGALGLGQRSRSFRRVLMVAVVTATVIGLYLLLTGSFSGAASGSGSSTASLNLVDLPDANDPRAYLFDESTTLLRFALVADPD